MNRNREKWTAVADGLPALYVDVICHNDMTQAMRVTHLLNDKPGYEHWHGWFLNLPTHWMPAPDPMPKRPDRGDEGFILFEGRL